MSTQFLRTYQLLVTAPGSSGSSGSGLDLSQLHFRFQIRAPDVQTPNNATIRIYNPSDNTALQIQKEYSSVIIQVGYQGGDFGQIFQGDIKWVRKGRENNTTKFVEIDAADGDLAYNKSIINQTLDGTSANQQGIASAIGSAFAANNVQAGDTSGFVNTTGGILPRGKVLFGMARAAARNLAKTSGKTWSIQNGVLVWTPLDKPENCGWRLSANRQ